MKKIGKSVRYEIGVGSLIIATLIVMAVLSPLRDLMSFDALVSWGEKLRSSGWFRWGYFFVFSAAVGVCPITLFAVIGGILFPFGVALPFNLLATATGALLPFFITRAVGRKTVMAYCQKRDTPIQHLAEARGLKTVFLIRWLGAPPFLMANYILGLSSVRLRDYFWGTVLGIMPWMILLTYASGSLWKAAVVGGQKGFMSALGVTVGPLMIMSAMILTGVLITAFVKHRRRRPVVPLV